MGERLSIPGSEDVPVLEGAETYPGASLMRLRADDSVAWRATPPTGVARDGWVDIAIDGAEVIARSWSWYLVRFDVETGAEVARMTTK